MIEKKKLALFDLDGTLFDTGDVNYHAYREALQPFGVELDRTYFVEFCNGRHYTEFLPQIMHTSEHLSAVHTAKKLAYARNLDKARENVWLLNILRRMREDTYTAIVTTASRQNVMDILVFFGCESLFDLIITQEDITHKKPDPEGFLKAMAHFGIAPENTIIFEDSDVGIAAARASGASVMIIDRF